MSRAEGGTGRAGAGWRFASRIAGVLHAWRLARRVRRAARPEASPKLPRSRLGAALDARRAVRSGVRLDDFLRQRLARYATRLPVPLEALPVSVDVEGGEAVVRARPRSGILGPRLGAPEPVRTPDPGAARVLRDAESEVDALAAREATARARLDAAERDLATAFASGAIVARPAVDATAEQLGRPAVDPAWPVHALRGLSAALLATETWRFSGTALAAAGISPDALDGALRETPLPAGLALLSAVGAATAAFTFAWLALARAAEAAATTPAGARGRLLLAWAAGAALLVPSVAAAATAGDAMSGLVLAATLPFAGAALFRGASALAARRAAGAALALGWDRERAQEEVERGRREEACARAAADIRAAAERRSTAEARLVALQRETTAAARIAELTAAAAAARLDRLAEGLAAALEQDRYAFLRATGQRAPAPREVPARTRLVDPTIGPERFGVTG